MTALLAIVAFVALATLAIAVFLRTIAAGAAQPPAKTKLIADIEPSDQLYRTVGEFIPFGIWHVGAAGEMRYISASYLDMLGMTVEQMVSGGWRERVPQDDQDAFLRAWADREKSGGTWESEYRIRGADGNLYHILSRGTRMNAADGTPLGWVGVSLDVTESKRSADRLAFLAEAGRTLGMSLLPDATLDRLAHLCVPAIADWCSIDVLQDDGSIKAVVMLHADPKKADLAAALRERFPTDRFRERGAANVIRTGRSEYYPDISDELLVRSADSHAHLDLARRVGFTSAIVVPLTARERTLAALTLAYADSGRRYAPEDFELAKLLGQRAALAYDNAKLFRREHRVAETLQRASLPTQLPNIPSVAVRATYQTGSDESEIGGDWYDAFELPDGKLAVSVGDVAGKGLKAAVAMSSARQALRAALFDRASPASALTRVNGLLCHENAGMVTAAVALIDVDRGSLVYATAGHPAMLLADRRGAIKPLSSRGIPMGIAHDNEFEERTAATEPGSLLVLYTDGLIEFERDIESGERALNEAVAAEAREPSANAAQSIAARVLSRRPNDDVAVLTVSLGFDMHQALDVTAPAEPPSARFLRRSLRRLSAAFGLTDDQSFRLLVASGEAISNSIEHAYGVGTGTVRIKAYRQNGHIITEIHDTGRWREPREEGRGHGIALMRELMDDVEITATPLGTTIRQRLALGRTRDHR